MKSVKLLLVVVSCLYLWGCASGAKMENMVFHGTQKSYPPEIVESLELEKVSGGEETNPAWTSKISNEAFSGAIKESLKSQGLYSDNGKYRLQVNLLKVEQPLFGLDLEVTTHVQYTLKDIDSGAVVLDYKLVASHTASINDAFVAVKRLRLANEGSAKNNIEGLLNKLSELRIAPNEISLAE